MTRILFKELNPNRENVELGKKAEDILQDLAISLGLPPHLLAENYPEQKTEIGDNDGSQLPENVGRTEAGL